MENSLKKLWCLVNFVQPGVLGPLEYFDKEYCKAILKGGWCEATEVQKESARFLVNDLRE